MKHELKIKEEYLSNLISGKKKTEIRDNDRDFQLGDILKFYYTHNGCWYEFKITHIHSGLGMREGYVALSVEQKEENDK